MEPSETVNSDNGGLDKNRLSEIVTRLKAVRRRCADDPGAAGRRHKAEESLDAVLTDLQESLEPDSEPMEIEDLDLRLATVEELFEATGSHGLGQIIGSIRNTLSVQPEKPSPGEEPPPPRRFQPSPTSAVRRRRPRPKSRKGKTSAKAQTRSGRFRWLKLMIVVGAAVAVAAFVYLRRIEPEITSPELPDRMEAREPVASFSEDAPAPREDFGTSSREDDFDLHEEDMASFTLEIHLAESALKDGNLSESLRHFAAAAAIDRHHRRVVSMGKSLIAALLHEADLAYDRGDQELAGKRVQNARNIARGLRLDDSAIDKTALKHASMTRFEDIAPRDAEALRNAVGHPVRLTLKTRDVIFGHLKGIQDDILLLDAYSGVKGGGVEFSTSILASTIKEVRVYDAKEPSEIMIGD